MASKGHWAVERFLLPLKYKLGAWHLLWNEFFKQIRTTNWKGNSVREDEDAGQGTCIHIQIMAMFHPLILFLGRPCQYSQLFGISNKWKRPSGHTSYFFLFFYWKRPAFVAYAFQLCKVMNDDAWMNINHIFFPTQPGGWLINWDI